MDKNKIALYERLFDKVFENFREKSEKNKEYAVALAEKFKKEGKVTLSDKILKLSEKINRIEVPYSNTMFVDHIMPTIPVEYEKNVDSNTDDINNFTKFKKSSNHNCAAFALDIFIKIIQLNSEYYKENKKLFFQNFAIVDAYPDHSFLIIITESNQLILVDHWYNNLICEFDADNIAKIGSLGGINNFKTHDLSKSLSKNLDELNIKYNKELSSIYNPFKLSQEKQKILEERFSKITEEFKSNRTLQMEMIGRANEDLEKMIKHTTKFKNAKLHFSARLFNNLYVISTINNYYIDSLNKINPKGLLDEYGVGAMIAEENSKNLTEVKNYTKKNNPGKENYIEENFDKIIVSSIEQYVDNIKGIKENI